MDDIRKQRGENPFAEPMEVLRASNPGEVAARAGASWDGAADGRGRLSLPVLGGEVLVQFPDIEIEAPGALAGFTLKLLSLLYLANSDGKPPSGEWTAYRDLSGARFYEPVLRRSVEDPVAARFASDVGGFIAACEAAGGVPMEYGDAACSFSLFPHVPVAFLLWRADEEFPERAQVLFDVNSTHHLTAFELRMGAQEIASILIKGAGEG
jgi:hypothetical protein